MFVKMRLSLQKYVLSVPHPQPQVWSTHVIDSDDSIPDSQCPSGMDKDLALLRAACTPCLANSVSQAVHSVITRRIGSGEADILGQESVDPSRLSSPPPPQKTGLEDLRST